MEKLNLCQELFGWGYSDIEFLEGLINNYCVDTEQLNRVVKEELGMDITKINNWLYGAMYLVGEEIKELIGGILDNITIGDEEILFDKGILMDYYVDDLSLILGDVEMNIYTDYIDTCFDNELYQWAMDNINSLKKLFVQVQNYGLEDDRFTMWNELSELITKIEKEV